MKGKRCVVCGKEQVKWRTIEPDESPFVMPLQTGIGLAAACPDLCDVCGPLNLILVRSIGGVTHQYDFREEDCP